MIGTGSLSTISKSHSKSFSLEWTKFKYRKICIIIYSELNEEIINYLNKKTTLYLVPIGKWKKFSKISCPLKNKFFTWCYEGVEMMNFNPVRCFIANEVINKSKGCRAHRTASCSWGSGRSSKTFFDFGVLLFLKCSF